MTATAQFQPHRFYTASEIAGMLKGSSKSGNSWQCKCPAHSDNIASLCVSETRERTLLKCHAGCDTRDIVSKLGIGMSNLFREAKATPSLDTVASYDYVDESGALSYQVVRKAGKQFSQRQPDRNGGWTWGLKGTKPLLYRLPEVLEAVALEKTIYVVEGEKDTDRLWQHGMPATTNSGGAGKWRPSHTEGLKGARVVILPDNDVPGQKHAEAVAALLGPVAASVKIVELPRLPDKGDVSDFLDAGGTVENLLAIAERTPPWLQRANEEPPADRVSKARITLTDDEELMGLEDPPWLVEGRIPRDGTVQVFGASGTFKSFVVVDLSCHVALGLDWHGKRVSQGNVVCICAEGVYGMKHRVAVWKQYHCIQGKLGLYFLNHGIDLKSGSPDVTELLAEVRSRVAPPPVLIVVDTLARNLVGNENATEDMSAYVKGCDELREATGATVLSVHHTGWTEADRARGSSSNRAAMDTDILCSRDGDRVTLKNTKQKDAAEFADISFEALSVGKSLVLKPIDQTGGKLDGNRLACLRAVHGMDDGATYGQWKKEAELEKKKSSFDAARNWLLASGYVKHAADKKYVVTDAGRVALGPQSITSPRLVHSSQVSGGPLRGGLLDPTLDQDPPLPFPTEAA